MRGKGFMNIGKIKIAISVILMLCLSQFATGQALISSVTSKAVVDAVTPPKVIHTHVSFTPSYNPVKLTVEAMFYTYKNFFSSQDGSHCPYAPSCSQYMVQSIRKYGFVKGLMNGSDRVQRCNAFSAGIHPKADDGRWIDKP